MLYRMVAQLVALDTIRPSRKGRFRETAKVGSVSNASNWAVFPNLFPVRFPEMVH
jgi:hypothetical protein